MMISAKTIVESYQSLTSRTADSRLADRDLTRLTNVWINSVIGNLNKVNKTQTILVSQDNTIAYPDKGWDMDDLNRIKRRTLFSQEGIYYEYPFSDSEGDYKSVFLVKAYEDIKDLRKSGIVAFIISFSISSLIALTISTLFSKRLYKPIALLSSSIKNFTERKEPVTVYHSNDEIEYLALQFKAMTDQIIQLDERQKQFFQNSSHELKTPLMSIQGYAEAIKDGIVTGDELEQSLNVIIAESQRLKGIVDDVIYVSKIDSMEDQIRKTSGNLSQVIHEASEVVKPLLVAANIKLEIVCDEAVMAEFDYEKMKRVFINLIGNGSRYAKSKIVVNVNQASGRTYIDVIDDGPGFEVGQEAFVFDRFHKGDKGGSGIGLSLTKEIIDKHGGSIRAVNNMNYGAIFKIEI